MKKSPVFILIGLVLAGFYLLPLLGNAGFMRLDAWFNPSVLDQNGHLILFGLRLPQSLSAFFIGASLATVGLVFQTLFKNDLADPYLLGISSGSALGVVISTRFGALLGLPLAFSSPVMAFVMAALTIGVVLLFTRSKGQASNTSMILVGTGMNFFLSSLILLVYYFSSPAQVFEVQRWFMGSIEMVGSRDPLLLGINMTIVLAVLFFFREDMNIMLLSDEMAASKGLDMAKTRILFVLLGSWLTAVCVSVAGPISFVGLISPHLAKLVFGRNHRSLFILNAALGGFFLLLCFTLSRMILSSSSLPVGIVTSLVGVPFLIWLLTQKK